MPTEHRLKYHDRISRDPRILAGKPVVKGTRISIEMILDYLAHNPNFEELIADYPRLTMDDVKACLDYARSAVQQAARSTDESISAAASSGGV